MLTVRTTGSIAEMIQAARDVHGRIVPYAAATALTRTARQIATVEMPDAMRAAFDRPTPYTLRSLYVKPADKETLSARVMVKDQSSGNGTLPEDYLLPSVTGGARKEKRFERSLRYSGILANGWRAITGKNAPLDAYGNLLPGEMQRMLSAVGGSFDRAQNRTKSAKSRKNAKNAPYFVVTPQRGYFSGGEYKVQDSKIQPGIYRRMGGRQIIPTLIFTKNKPTYRAVFDFEGIAEKSALTHFKPEFDRALAALLAR